MHMLVLSLLFVGMALAAPQGYNYQLNVIPDSNGALTYPQVQAIQQFASQQEQSVIQQQIVSLAAAEAPAPTQHIAPAGDNGGSQFATQLIQLASYGQQQQIQQQVQQQQQQQQQQAQQQSLPQSLALPKAQLQPQIQQQPLPLPQQQPEIKQEPQLPPQQLPLPQVQPQFIPQQQAPAQQQPQPQPQVQQPLPQPLPQPVPQSIPQPIPQSIPQPEVQQPQQSVQYPSAPLPPVPQAPQPTHYQPSPALAPQTAYYNKEFYYLAAPQENYELPADFDDQLRKMKKNMRILFIKAPEQTGLEKAALQLVKDAQQPQTAIYVLTKQHSAAELAKKLQQQPSAAKEKPEVIFIKYRTRHEAEQAQRTIQAQYEALNGPNHFNFESVAKTENFVSPTAVIEPRAAPVQESAAATSSTLDYLPPAQ